MADRKNTPSKIRYHRTKSYKSIYDIFVQKRENEAAQSKENHITAFQEFFNDPHRKFSGIRQSYMFGNTPYVTSEKYHALNKRSSDRSIVRSTSTLFYDLDNLAKRHSYHCAPDVKITTNNIVNLVQDCRNKSGFDAKSDAIVQKYAKDIQPRINAKDSVTIITKKVKKSSPNDSLISSEIHLKDSECMDKIIDYNEKQQKFWSYAKYRTEYTKPIPEEKKIKNMNRGKRIEDPCPCQLFSYACPCNDNKSLTKLGGNSNTITVENQIISAMRVNSCHKAKSENSIILADKETNARASDLQAECEAAKIFDNRIRHNTNTNGSNHTCNKIKPNNSCKHRCNKKTRQIVCPNCNEKVEVVTLCEQEEGLKLNLSPVHRIQENSSPAQYSYVSNMSQKSKPLMDKDSCKHEPPCELVPVCQILPAEQVHSNSTKCFKGATKIKNTPRTIKVTKACRHHPPCTVAPSCQRLNVLKNNCEYIPPCLHQPRCINLPLCIPFSKTLDYDELLNKTINEEDNMEYPVFTTPQYVPPIHRESLNNNQDQCYRYPASHNTCEYVSEYEPRYFFTPKITCTSPTYSPYRMPCDFPKSNKSCQYECRSSKRNTTIACKESVGGDDIIYIRDVGCQFRNRHHTRENSSIRCNTFNGSFEDQAQTGNFFSNYHTLRYEDKFTNPLSCGDHSMSTISTSSIEIDVHCPSHGKDSKKVNNNKLISGFQPRQSPIVANCALDDPIFKLCMPKCSDLNKRVHTRKTRRCLHTRPVSSRKCFLKNKCKKVFSVRRRRKSRLSYQSILSSSSTKLSTDKNTL